MRMCVYVCTCSRGKFKSILQIYTYWLIAIISQNQSTQRYLPNVALGEEQLKQMIKGGGAAQNDWQQQRAQQQIKDVKTELAKLNTSEYLKLQSIG